MPGLSEVKNNYQSLLVGFSFFSNNLKEKRNVPPWWGKLGGCRELLGTASNTGDCN